MDLLADELGRLGDDDLESLDLADAGRGVVEADLAELQLELLAHLDRRGRGELLDGALLEHAHVVEMDVVDPDEEEPPLRDLLELLEPRAVGRRSARRSSRSARP